MKYAEADHPILYGVARAGVSAHEKVRHNLDVRGTEYIPDGGAVLAMSHRDAVDAFVSGAAMPRPVFYMAKDEMWTEKYGVKIPFSDVVISAGTFATLFGVFPVNRANPGHSTMRHARELVRDKKIVGIFPEQTRYQDEVNRIVRGPELGHLSKGVATIAASEGVPIIPMGIGVTREANKKGRPKIVRVAAVIKECIKPIEDPEMPNKLIIDAMMAILRERLQEAHDEAAVLAA